MTFPDRLSPTPFPPTDVQSNVATGTIIAPGSSVSANLPKHEKKRRPSWADSPEDGRVNQPTTSNPHKRQRNLVETASLPEVAGMSVIDRLNLKTLPDNVPGTLARALADHKLGEAKELLEKEANRTLSKETLPWYCRAAIRSKRQDWMCALLALSSPEEIDNLYHRYRNEEGVSLLHGAFRLKHPGIDQVIAEYPYLLIELDCRKAKTINPEFHDASDSDHAAVMAALKFPDGSKIKCGEISAYWSTILLNHPIAPEGNAALLWKIFNSEQFKRENMPITLPFAMKEGGEKLFGASDEVYRVDIRKWNDFGKHQCRLLDEERPWHDGQEELRLKVFGIRTEDHAMAIAYVVAKNKNGEKLYVMLFHDPNNPYLVKMAITTNLEGVRKWTFENLLQNAKKNLSALGIDAGNNEVTVCRYSQEAAMVLETGNALTPLPQDGRRIISTFANENDLIQSMTRAVLGDGFEGTLNDLQIALRAQIKSMSSTQVKASLCPMHMQGMPCFFSTVEHHTGTALRYLDLIENLPVDDALKWEIVFTKDKFGNTVLDLAVFREDGDLRVMRKLLQFANGLNVSEEKKVPAYAAMMKMVLRDGLTGALDVLKDELPALLKNMSPAHVKNVLCPRRTNGTLVFIDTVINRADMALRYLGLIRDLPIDDELKLAIPFERDGDGDNALRYAVHHGGEDLAVMKELIRFGDRLNDALEDEKVRGYSGKTDDYPSPLNLEIMGDSPEKITALIEAFIESKSLSEKSKAILAAAYCEGGFAVVDAFDAEKQDNVAAYEKAVEPIKGHSIIQQVLQALEDARAKVLENVTDS